MRKWKINLIALISVAAGPAVLFGVAPASASCACTPIYNYDSCGHRGTGVNSASNPYPENTIPSFQQAAAEGATMIELDVLHSLDGKLVVIHNDTVDGATDGTGCVGEMTVEQLKELDAGVGTDLEGTGVEIPTLSEVIDQIDIDINIEIKMKTTAACPDSNKLLLAADVLDAIKADKKDRRIIISSFDAEVLSEVRLIDRDIFLALLGYNAGIIDMAVEREFNGINMNGGSSDADDIAAAHDAGLAVGIWTINDPEKILEFIEAGADIIITDEPDIAEGYRLHNCEAKKCDDTDDESVGLCSAAPARNNWWGLLIPLAAALMLLSSSLRKKRLV